MRERRGLIEHSTIELTNKGIGIESVERQKD